MGQLLPEQTDVSPALENQISEFLTRAIELQIEAYCSGDASIAASIMTGPVMRNLRRYRRAQPPVESRGPSLLPAALASDDPPAPRYPDDLIILLMNKLIAVVGVSGVGKTALVRALAKAYPFATAFEGHAERPFQVLFKHDPHFALANQIDYFLVRAEQERQLRASAQIGLVDGGLDLDYHGFTRLFHSRGLLSDPEFDLCRRVYQFIREFLPPPDLFIRLHADEETVARRLARRDRVNIARVEDTARFDSFLNEWLSSIPPDRILELDVSRATIEYRESVELILYALRTRHWLPS